MFCRVNLARQILVRVGDAGSPFHRESGVAFLCSGGVTTVAHVFCFICGTEGVLIT